MFNTWLDPCLQEGYVLPRPADPTTDGRPSGAGSMPVAWPSGHGASGMGAHRAVLLARPARQRRILELEARAEMGLCSARNLPERKDQQVLFHLLNYQCLMLLCTGPMQKLDLFYFCLSAQRSHGGMFREQFRGRRRSPDGTPGLTPPGLF